MPHNSTGYDRTKGSKKEQGIVTPPSPKSCGCVFQGLRPATLCLAHKIALDEAVTIAMQALILMQNKEEKQPEQTPTEPEKPAKPWVEDVGTAEDVSVQLT